MSELLVAAKHKVDRAVGHLGEVKRLIADFYRANPASHWYEAEPKQGYQLLKLRTLPVPPEIAMAVGDTVSNLRASLDFLANAVVGLTGEGRVVYFPFAQSEEGFRKMYRIRKALKAMPEEIRAYFESLKPYRHGNDFLWSLTCLRNIDCHQGLVPLAGSVPGFANRQVLADWWVGPVLVEVPKHPVLFDPRSTGHRPPVADVGFGDIDVVGGLPVTPVLTEYCRLVGEIIATCEPHFTLSPVVPVVTPAALVGAG